MPDIRFCSRCGSPLRPEDLAVARCSACQADLSPVLFRNQPAGADLRKVARAQRQLLYCVGLMILVQIASALLYSLASPPSVVEPLEALVSCSGLVLSLIALVFAVQLMAATGMHILVRALLVVLLFAPCINLLVLLGINHRATKLLRRAGVRVGLLGARDEDVIRRISSLHCRNCGYLLVGNVSGICPECGTPVAGNTRVAVD